MRECVVVEEVVRRFDGIFPASTLALLRVQA
jgi:hypothetical protein